jgi:hypothetical protein
MLAKLWAEVKIYSPCKYVQPSGLRTKSAGPIGLSILAPLLDMSIIRRGVRVTIKPTGFYGHFKQSKVRGTVMWLNPSGKWTVWMDEKVHPHGRFRAALPDDLQPIHVIHLLAEIVDPPEPIDPS